MTYCSYYGDPIHVSQGANREDLDFVKGRFPYKQGFFFNGEAMRGGQRESRFILEEYMQGLRCYTEVTVVTPIMNPGAKGIVEGDSKCVPFSQWTGRPPRF